MSGEPKPHRAHLYLIEVLIAVLLLAVAAFFLVRGMQQARHRAEVEAQEAHHREQLRDLDEALGSGDEKAIWLLCRANPEFVHTTNNHRGYTPLHIAVYEGNKEMVQWLLDHNADIDFRDGRGWTPLHYAIIAGQRETTELLLAQGASLNAEGRYGDSPLHTATTHGYKDIAKLLLLKGADVDAKNFNNQTPLQHAITNGHKDIADLLRKHGAKE